MKKEIEELKTWNDPATLSHDEIKSLIEKAKHQERERITIKLEKLRDDAKKYPAKYHPDFPEKSNGYNEGFNQAMRDVIDIIKTLNQ